MEAKKLHDSVESIKREHKEERIKGAVNMIMAGRPHEEPRSRPSFAARTHAIDV